MLRQQMFPVNKAQAQYSKRKAQLAPKSWAHTLFTKKRNQAISVSDINAVNAM